MSFSKKLNQTIWLILGGSWFGLLIIGIINRVSGRKLNTVFVMYPANHKYIDMVMFRWYAKYVKWRPRLFGFFWHKKGGGVSCVITANEAHFENLAYKDNLNNLHQHATRVAKIIGASHISYAGILPKYIVRSGIKRDHIEGSWTASWVVEAIKQVLSELKNINPIPIVIIGSRGEIGTRVINILKQELDNDRIIEIDSKHPDSKHRNANILEDMRNQPVLIVNIARNGTIDEYYDKLWPGVTLLNEVYPPADKKIVDYFKENNIRYLHIKGVNGYSFPLFPGPYQGAIPCCAASASTHHHFDVKSDLLIREF